MKWPRKKSLKKFKDAIRAKTQRTNGDSLHSDHRGRQPHAARLV